MKEHEFFKNKQMNKMMDLMIEKIKMSTSYAIMHSIGLIACGLMFWAQARFGSLPFFFAYLQGARLQILPTEVELGTHRPEENFQTVVTLKNYGKHPITIVGILSSCDCVKPKNLPVTIFPNKAAILPITIKFGRNLGTWQRSITYLTDDDEQQIINTYLKGFIATH